MSSPAAQTQWYLARDGQQYGPLSEAELGRFVELGHLQPTDLLWREGFPDWRPAMVVFPPRPSAPGRPGASPHPTGSLVRPGPARQASAPRARPASKHSGLAREDDDMSEGAPRARGLRRALLGLVCIALLAGGGWYANSHRESLLRFMHGVRTWVPAGLIDVVTDKMRPTARNLENSPFKGLTGPADSLEPTL